MAHELALTFDKPGPLLLGYASSQDSDFKVDTSDISSWKHLPEHRDEGQVQLDVDRSFIFYPNGTSFSLVTYHNSTDTRPFAQTSPLKRSSYGKKNSPT